MKEIDIDALEKEYKGISMPCWDWEKVVAALRAERKKNERLRDSLKAQRDRW